MIQQTTPSKPLFMEFLEQTYLLDKSLAHFSQVTLKLSCRQFVEFIGDDRPIDEISESDISHWVKSMEDDEKAPNTIRGKRADVVGVLAYAAAYDLRKELNTKRIRKTKIPQPLPKAWTIAEFNRLVAAAAELKGCMLDGVPRRDYWTALLGAAYDTGLRRTDLMSLKASDIDEEGKIWLTQHKSGAAICRRLRSSTLTAIQHLTNLKGDVIFRIPGRNGEEGHRNQLNKWWPKIRKLAEVEDCGAFHQIRRTGASYIEREQPGSAQAYLGHLTPDMKKFYLDHRISGSNPLLPPDVATFEQTEQKYLPDAPNLTVLLEQYIEAKEPVKLYRRQIEIAVDRFVAFLRSDPSVDTITHEQICEWSNSLGNILSDKKIQYESYLIRQLMRFAVDEEIRGPLVVKPQNK